MIDIAKEANLRYKDLLKFGVEKMLDCNDIPLFPFTINKFTPVIVNRKERNFVVDLGDEPISNKDFKVLCNLAKDFKVSKRGFELKRSSVKSALFFYWL